jgi:hypothetical protein
MVNMLEAGMAASTLTTALNNPSGANPEEVGNAALTAARFAMENPNSPLITPAINTLVRTLGGQAQQITGQVPGGAQITSAGTTLTQQGLSNGLTAAQQSGLASTLGNVGLQLTNAVTNAVNGVKNAFSR